MINTGNHKINQLGLVCVRVSLLLVFALTLVALPSGERVNAQSSPGGWTEPINLSHSGSTANPNAVLDSNELLHVIWADEFAGVVYTVFDGTQWSNPLAADFPFAEGISITLGAGSDGRVHAFWVDEDGALFSSFVQADEFANPVAWDVPKNVAESALDVDVVRDAQGNLHLLYLRILDTAEAPAGIYYKKSLDDGLTWSFATPLYQSLYYRDAQSDIVNLDIEATQIDGATRVYAVWDNRVRKQVLGSMSNDAGDTWQPPVEVDKPEPTSGVSTPFGIKVSANGKNTVYTWLYGEPEVSCIQYFQGSVDGGDTWSAPAQMLGSLFGCPSYNQLFIGNNGLIFLVTIIQDQVYLTAWDGVRWSDPQAQFSLNGFQDPETYTTLSYQCPSFYYQSGQDRLISVGCDVTFGQDIWSTSRIIGPIGEWFPPPTSWGLPVMVSSSEQEILSPELVVDKNEGVHLFWNQLDDPATISDEEPASRPAIYYAVWEENKLSTPAAIIKVGDEATVELSALADYGDRLHLVWSGGRSGALMYSWANTVGASVSTEWESVVNLPTPARTISSPDIFIDSTGALIVVYAVPLNEDRGIYLIKSTDDGSTWSDPVKVVDALVHGWEMVDDPVLAQTGGNRLHLLFTEYAIPAGPRAVALYYTHSEDGGLIWSEPEQVVQRPIGWSQVIGIGDQEIHRLWQESSRNLVTLWQEVSNDNGQAWSLPSIISGLYDTAGPASISVDHNDRLYLYQLAKRGEGDYSIQQWFWNLDRWEVDDNLELGQNAIVSAYSLDSGISQAGNLGVIYSGRLGDGSENNGLFFVRGGVSVAMVLPVTPTLTAQPTHTPAPPTSTDTPLVVETLASTPTDTPQIETTASPTRPTGTGSSRNQVMGIVVGIGLVLFLLVIAIGSRRLLARRNRQ